MATLKNTIVQQTFPADRNHEWKEPFVFIQGADTQLGMIASYVEKRSDLCWEAEKELTRRAIVAANKMQPRPKFFIVCGDLVNEFPGKKGREEQVRDFKLAFEELDNEIPLVCVCGNHDVGDVPTPESVAKYRSDYGDDYFSFVVSGVLMIVINSQYYENRDLVKDVAEQQDAWLDAQLAGAKDKNYKHIIVFQHIPWFLRAFDEEKEYFNIEQKLRMKMLDKFYDAGVRLIMCGHYHRNTGGMYKELELVVTSAVGAQLGTDKSGVRVVRVHEDRVDHTYYAVDEIPEKVAL